MTQAFSTLQEAAAELEEIVNDKDPTAMDHENPHVISRAAVPPRVILLGNWLTRAGALFLDPKSRKIAVCGKHLIRTALYALKEYNGECIPDGIVSWIIDNLGCHVDECSDDVDKEIAHVVLYFWDVAKRSFLLP